MAGEALTGTLALMHIRAHVCRCLLVEQRGWVGTDAHLKQGDESLLFTQMKEMN